MNKSKIQRQEIGSPPVSTIHWRYTGPAIFLHWLLAFLIVGMVMLGWYMMSVEHQPGSEVFFNVHKSFGITVFILVMIRLLWRFTHQPAALPSTMPQWEIKLSEVTQWLMYIGMFLLPIFGFLGASYSKSGVIFFSLQLPRWRVADHDTAEFFFSIHSAIVWVMVALIALHVAGALKHLLINRDRVFQRMWF